MNIQILKEAIERGVPFYLKTADGDRLDVPHPDLSATKELKAAHLRGHTSRRGLRLGVATADHHQPYLT